MQCGSGFYISSYIHPFFTTGATGRHISWTGWTMSSGALLYSSWLSSLCEPQHTQGSGFWLHLPTLYLGYKLSSFSLFLREFILIQCIYIYNYFIFKHIINMYVYVLARQTLTVNTSGLYIYVCCFGSWALRSERNGITPIHGVECLAHLENEQVIQCSAFLLLNFLVQVYWCCASYSAPLRPGSRDFLP